MAIDLGEVSCDRYFAKLQMADAIGPAMCDCHVPVERDTHFEFVAELLANEWKRYWPGHCARLRRALG
jgi:hypothetical protein